MAWGRRGPRHELGDVGAAVVVLSVTAMALGIVGMVVATAAPADPPAPTAAAIRPTPATALGPTAADPSTSLSPNGAISVAGFSGPAAGSSSVPDPSAGVPDPSSGAPAPSSGGSSTAQNRFPGGMLIADRGNGRLLIVTEAGRIVWSFPGPNSLPRGQRFSADDAFVAPDGRTIVANDEAHQVIDRIDIATRRLIWQYGAYGQPGSGRGQLHTPDDAYPLANGDIVVADIRNCRIVEIAPSKQVVRQWGRTGSCADHPPRSFAMPNGDTPLPDGGLLITEITGSRVVRLAPDGHVIFDVHVPVAYPSDAHLTSDGSILVVDYAKPGAVIRLSPSGHLLWRYAPRAGPGALDHPSLAIPLPDGTIALNDDFRHRVVVIDPRTDQIVWQYGMTGRPGRGPGYLNTPDGIDVVPAGTIPVAG